MELLRRSLWVSPSHHRLPPPEHWRLKVWWAWAGSGEPCPAGQGWRLADPDSPGWLVDCGPEAQPMLRARLLHCLERATRGCAASIWSSWTRRRAVALSSACLSCQRRAGVTWPSEGHSVRFWPAEAWSLELSSLGWGTPGPLHWRSLAAGGERGPVPGQAGQGGAHRRIPAVPMCGTRGVPIPEVLERPSCWCLWPGLRSPVRSCSDVPRLL